MKFHIPFLVLARVALGNAEGSYLRKEHNDLGSPKSPVSDTDMTELLLTKLLQRIEYLETRVYELDDLETRVDQLEDAVDTIKSSSIVSGSTDRQLAVDEQCSITYNNITGMCHMTQNMLFHGDTMFQRKAQMKGGAGIEDFLEVDGSAVLQRGLQVFGGLISVNTTMRLGNLTIDGTTGKKQLHNDPRTCLETLFCSLPSYLSCT